jgi:hypothetical protein
MDAKSSAMHIGTSSESAGQRSAVSEVYALLTGAYRRSSSTQPRNLDDVDGPGARGRAKRNVYADSESLDFDETESITWRKVDFFSSLSEIVPVYFV